MNKLGKRTGLLLLLLSLLLSSCGTNLPTKANGETSKAENPAESTAVPATDTAAPEAGTTAPEESTTMPEESTAPEAKESLWEKKISGEAVKIPEKAFAGGAERCTAMAADGQTLLMSGGAAPYLYHLETEQSLPLVPANESDEAYLRELLALRNGIAIKATEEQMEQIRTRLAGMSGKALTQELCTYQGRIQALRLYANGYYTRENYLILIDTNFTAMLVLNCDSGQYSCNLESGMIPCGIRDGKLLYFINPLSSLKLLDLKSGEIQEMDVRLPSVYPNGNRLRAAGFMSDGSFAVVLSDLKLDAEAGQNCTLVICGPDGSVRESYPLGRIRYQWEPDVILSAGSEFVIVYSRQAVRQNAPYFIDRTAKEVLRLTAGEDGLVHPAPIAAEGEAEKEAAGMIPLDSFADDDTLLLQNLRDAGNFVLFRPADRQSKRLLPGLDGFPLVITFSSNHYDRFMDSGHPEEKVYYQLTFR